MKNPQIIAQSPGRINIIGEHTDYNEGLVLPAAIDKHTTVQLKKNHDQSKCRVLAKNVDEVFEFELQDLKPLKKGWQNYVMGVVAELQRLGVVLSGFDGEIEGNVPIGSGMSSSAALESSLAYGLNELFELRLDPWQLIKVCQMAEHNFAGIKCGIMDQFASVMGKKNQVMLLDCRTLSYDYYPFDLGAYQVLLLNTNVAHALADSAYNTRREECEYGVHFFQKKYEGINSLRDVSVETLSAEMTKLPQKVAQRCRHVIGENDRVVAATRALVDKEYKILGELLYQSHDSLQHDYEVSCAELDFLVDQTKNKPYVLGSRMMGGGFGGCTINIIEKKWVEPFVEEISKRYKNQFGLETTPYSVSIGNGASLKKVSI